MIAENDPLSFGNHLTYIAPCAGFDNEAAFWTLDAKKGPNAGPLK
jgi:hypothetical protein